MLASPAGSFVRDELAALITKNLARVGELARTPGLALLVREGIPGANEADAAGQVTKPIEAILAAGAMVPEFADLVRGTEFAAAIGRAGPDLAAQL